MKKLSPRRSLRSRFSLLASCVLPLAGLTGAGAIAADTTPPSVPTGLRLVELRRNDGFAIFNPSTDNVGVAYYKLYVDGVVRAYSVGTATGIIFTNPNPAAAHSVRVLAVDTSGNASAQSASVFLPVGPVALAPQPADRFLIDFGDLFLPGYASYDPDAWGDLWNHVDLSYSTHRGLITAEGTARSADVIRDTTWGNDHWSGVGSGVLYPFEAEVDGLLVYPGQTSSFHLTGLNPSLRYTVRLFGSENTLPNVRTRYTVNGIAQDLAAGGNTSNVVEYSGVSPTGAGEIAVGLTVAPNYNYGVLNVMELIVEVPDTTPPSTPGSLIAYDVRPHSVFFSFNESVDDVQIAGYLLRRDGVEISNFYIPSGDPSKVHMLADNGCTPGATHTYSIVAKDTSGNLSVPRTLQVAIPSGSSPVQAGDRFLIDLSRLGSVDTISSSDLWSRTWNNWVEQHRVRELMTVDGIIRSVGIDGTQYQNGFTGVTDRGYRSTPGYYPATAQRDSLLVYQSTGTLPITGLNPSFHYTVRLFASTNSGVSAPMIYTVNGVSQTLDVGKNDFDRVEFADVTVSANGRLVINVAPGPGQTWGALGAIELIAQDPAAPPVSDLAYVPVGSVLPGDFYQSGIDLNLFARGGRFIGYGEDRLGFANEFVVGDFDYRVQNFSALTGNYWDRSGLMVRNGMGATEYSFSLIIRGDGVFETVWRKNGTGGRATHYAERGKRWMRIIRTGSTFRSYASTDGTHWSYCYSMSIPSYPWAYVGVAGTSAGDSSPQTTRFRYFGPVQ